MKVFFLFIIIISLVGCQRTKTTLPDSKKINIPEKFSYSGSLKVDMQWWKVFKSSELTRLIETALKNAPDMKIMSARLKTSIAIAKKAGATRFPSVDASGKSGLTGIYTVPDKTSGQFTMSLDISVSYELDIWGRAASQRKSAEMDVLTVKYDMMGSAMTLAGEIAGCWFRMVSINRRMEILKKQYKTSSTYHESQKIKFDSGLLETLDLLQQKQNLASIQAIMTSAEVEMETEKNRLAVLMGVLPTELKLKIPLVLEPLPELPHMGVPLQVVSRRPDVLKAWYEMLSADASVAHAVADAFPKISLTLSAGTRAEKIRDMLKSWLVNLLLNVTAPVWRGGELKAEIERAKAVFEEKTVRWQQAVISSVIDIETILAKEKLQKKYIESIREQIELSKKFIGDIEYRYKQGITDFSIYLNAVNYLLGLELNLVKARVELYILRTGLLKAIAGPPEKNKDKDK
ncbi:TolC family protein [Myxococcota bacterium]|nr:TolC family protein [Myxococcota bacterium]MBU1379317.1 TolC family protein [Myxococcota bacterium]MBU1497729.1 TolC family protein [Myxococcota bacterium]